MDALGNATMYGGLGPGIARALQFLNDPQTRALEPSGFGAENSLRQAIEGEEIFALIQRYRTRPPRDAFWEAHRKYVDVQCVVEGVECMGHAPIGAMITAKPYDADRDLTVLEPDAHTPCNFINVKAMHFTVFFPHDAHMPGLMANGVAAEVKKIVVKVAV